MKFCTKCGNELFDEAVVCMKCGCAVGTAVKNPKPASAPVQSRAHTEKKSESGVLPAFNFIFDLSTVLANLMLWISVAYAYIYTYSTSWSLYSYLWLDFGCVIMAFILSIVSLGFGITCFCVTLAKHHKGDKLFAGITRFIVGIGFFVTTLLVLSQT